MHYNCLIVDDETELAKMTAEYFMMFDVSTAYVSSAADCYAFLEGNTVDLLLLDINLGDGSGFEVCRKVREEMSIPILFISARQSDDDVLVALSIGGDDYVKKPYSLSVLLAKVRVNLKRIEQMEKLKQDAKAVVRQAPHIAYRTAQTPGSGHVGGIRGRQGRAQGRAEKQPLGRQQSGQQTAQSQERPGAAPQTIVGPEDQ